MKKVRVGMIGCGFAAELHMNGYKRVTGIDVDVKSVASRTMANASAFAQRHGIVCVYEDYRELLSDPDIDVIDIVTPEYTHISLATEALGADKHIICEKPLTGFFKTSHKNELIGKIVPKSTMFQEVMRELDHFKSLVEKTSKLFMYAENWVYAPSILKSAELLRAKKSKIIYMKGEATHNGSAAQHAPYWRCAGGGALIRNGCHPLSAILHLKRASAGDGAVSVQSVMADTGNVEKTLTEDQHRYILARASDVEDIATVVLTFSDQTKATIFVADTLIGGSQNHVEVFTNDSVHKCRMTMNDSMIAYNANEKGIEDIYFSEKQGSKQGWNYLSIEEPVTRGYVGEMQDFMESVAERREPLSGFPLAYDTTKLIYAAFVSAEENRRIELA